MLAAICYPHTHLPEAQLLDRVRRLPADDRDRARCTRTSASARTAGTSRAARSSAPRYRFDVLGDYGAFRDLQRHRMLTIEWQQLSPRSRLRACRKPVVDAGLGGALRRRDGALGRAARRARRARSRSRPRTRSSLAYRMRYVMQMNAREAMHLCELRSSPQGHPSYRRDRAGDAPADRGARRAPRDRGRDALRRSRTYELERLDAERAAEARRVVRELTRALTDKFACT